MPAPPIISRRARKSRATVVHIAPYRGNGGRKPSTMSARRADRLFVKYAPTVIFPNQAANFEHRYAAESRIPDPDSYLGDNDASGFQAAGGIGQGADAPLIEIFYRNNRSLIGERKRLSENWKETEQVFAQFLHFGSAASICTCLRKDRVNVRLLALESWVTKDIDYCNCPLSATALIKKGFFPATPRKPNTAFSMRLLQVLHEQSIRGSISKSAWADGLRAVYESDLKMSLPVFSRQVAVLLPLPGDMPLTISV